jgi:hypothetical protein
MMAPGSACSARAGEEGWGSSWWVGLGGSETEREREGGKQGCVGQPREKEKWSEPKGIINFFIYSNNFQSSSKYFDQKVDLPSSKNFK